jgi:hypothetical protein
METKQRLTPFERVYYTLCALALIVWCLYFGAWMLFTPYPPILYP